jgi:crotonobetainyl-CoA:carnitine CoA-transferase CaiB-like acyl-CoA transferase
MTKDGHWLQFSNISPRQARALIHEIGMVEEFTEAGVLKGTAVVTANMTEGLWQRLLERICDKPLDEWMTIFEANLDVCFEVIRDTQSAMDHPQIVHSGIVIEVDDPQHGLTKQVGPLISFADTPSVVQGPAVALGANTEEVIAAAGRPRPGTACPGESVSRRPLEGVTVLELAGYVTGPFGGTLLADLGARVIKVEPLEGDPLRLLGTATKMVQGKESLTLDLKSTAGLNVLYSLVKRADMLLHNYRPGVPARLGIDYETLAKINPRLIYLFQSAYGSSGHLLSDLHSIAP